MPLLHASRLRETLCDRSISVGPLIRKFSQSTIRIEGPADIRQNEHVVGLARRRERGAEASRYPQIVSRCEFDSPRATPSGTIYSRRYVELLLTDALQNCVPSRCSEYHPRRVQEFLFTGLICTIVAVIE